MDHCPLPASGSAMTLFGPRRFDRTSGQPNYYVEQFSLPEGTISPFTLHIQNGSLDGTNRVDSAVVKVNGVSHVSGKNNGYLDATTTIFNVQTGSGTPIVTLPSIAW